MPKKIVTTTAITKWDEELARQATLATGIIEGVGAGGQFISLRAGRMTIDGAPVPDNKLSAVVVDYILENDWYEGAFDADSPVSPDCYAYARSNDDLAPHEKASNPQGGPDGKCAGCPKNEFGTANVGKGKACQNRVRLALMPESGLENIEKAEIRHLKVPPTSLRGWASYVRQLASVLHRPPFGVVTLIEEVPDDKTQFKLLFTVKEKIDDPAQLEALIEKKRAVEAEIEFPYQEMIAAPQNNARSVRRRGQTVSAPRKRVEVPTSPKAPPRAGGFMTPTKRSKG
jgi:hypothetical protein